MALVNFHKIFLLLICFFILKDPAFALNDYTPEEGHWVFYKRIFRGEERLPLRTTLIFDFINGKSRVYWAQEDDPGFCERKGIYSYNNTLLTDTVTWVNPKNKFECALDPDMRLGNQTKTRAEIVDDELFLYLTIGEDDLIYVFKRDGYPAPKDLSNFFYLSQF